VFGPGGEGLKKHQKKLPGIGTTLANFQKNFTFTKQTTTQTK
jgi:hypothetical protein